MAMFWVYKCDSTFTLFKLCTNCLERIEKEKERERERMKERIHTTVKQMKIVFVCVYVCERERETERNMTDDCPFCIIYFVVYCISVIMLPSFSNLAPIYSLINQPSVLKKYMNDELNLSKDVTNSILNSSILYGKVS